MSEHRNLIKNRLKIITVVSTTWEASLRFYTSALGYQVMQAGRLNTVQKALYGEHLNQFVLLGHSAEGSLVRLLESRNLALPPQRLGAKPWDKGLAVFEAGTPDIERAYYQVLQNRIGATAPPTEFDTKGPEPLGHVFMKSTGFIGPAGEQIFVTQIMHRKGGRTLLNESAVEGINSPGNAVISMQDRQSIEQFWQPIMGISPVNDLPLVQAEAARIMGGPPEMGFDMLLTGYGDERIGLEQHIYAPHNPKFTYQVFPCSFEKTGLAMAGWQANELLDCLEHLKAYNVPLLSEGVGLPILDKLQPQALVLRAPLGELIELLID